MRLRSPAAKHVMLRGGARAVTDRLGLVRAPGVMLANRIVEMAGIDIHLQPVIEDELTEAELELQDPATGAFWFLPGFSAVGGPDVLR